jgi:hypothetical protein
MPKLSLEQTEWVFRRDYFVCNFHTKQAGAHKFFCRKQAVDVYEIQYFYQNFFRSQRVRPTGYISLCRHHFVFMTCYAGNFSWDKELSYVALVNTSYYKIHAPEDLFPT